MEENPNLYWHNPTWYTYRNDFAALFCLDGDTLTWYPSLGTRIGTQADNSGFHQSFHEFQFVLHNMGTNNVHITPGKLAERLGSNGTLYSSQIYGTDRKFDIISQNIRINSIGFIYFRIFPKHTCLHAFAHWSRYISDWIGAGWDALESHCSIRAWQAWGFGDKEPKVDTSTKQPVSISIWRIQRCGDDLESWGIYYSTSVRP